MLIMAQDIPHGDVVGFSGDVIFQATFSGAHGATSHVEESPLHATVSMTSNVSLSNLQSTLGLATSLRNSNIIAVSYAYVEHNTVYDHLCDGDFTIEGFVFPSTLGLGHVIGVWAGSGQQIWRMVYDAQQLFFQCYQGGSLFQFNAEHGWLANSWHWATICRFHRTLRMWSDGFLIVEDDFPDAAQIPASPSSRLYISGTGNYDGMSGYLQAVRLTKKAWYTTSDDLTVPTQMYGFGTLYPIHYGDDVIFDQFYIPWMGQILPPVMVDADATFAPTATKTPVFVNSGMLEHSPGTGAGVVLPSSRVNGNLLIAVVQVNGGGQTFSVSAGWTIGDQQQDANGSSAWAWRIVDGTEANPTFSWTNTLSSRVTIYQFKDNHASAPIGNKLKSKGVGTAVSINSGVGVTTTQGQSLAFTVVSTQSDNQIIPLPTGYTNAVVSGSTFTLGSHRAAYEFEGVSGVVSSPVTATIASAVWHGYLIEIKRP